MARKDVENRFKKVRAAEIKLIEEHRRKRRRPDPINPIRPVPEWASEADLMRNTSQRSKARQKFGKKETGAARGDQKSSKRRTNKQGQSPNDSEEYMG